MPGCKIGDMAILIQCPDHPEWVGLVVEVIETSSEPKKPHWKCWNVRHKDKIFYFKKEDSIRFNELDAVPDFALIPIRPPEEDTDTSTELKSPIEIIKELTS